MKRPAWYAAGILVFAFAIRLWGLGAQSFFNEEGYSVWLSQLGIGRIVSQTASLDSNTPLHYLLLGAWVGLAGDSEFSARLLSVFAGVITIVLSYALARTSLPGRPQAALWTAALLSAWPICMAVSQEARMYALLLCLNTGSVAQLLRGMARGRDRDWRLWGVAAVTAFATHVLGAVVFAVEAMAVTAWWFARRRRDRIPSTAPLWAVGVTGFIIAAWIIAILLVSVPTSTTYEGGLNYFSLLPQAFAANVAPPVQTEPALAVAALAGLGLMAAGLASGSPRSRLVALIAAAGILAVVAVGARTGKYGWRYGAVLAPVVVTGAAVALARLQSRLNQRAARVLSLAVVAAIVTGGVSFAAWRLDPANANIDFRGAARYLRQTVTPGETVILMPDFSAVFEHYYGPGDWYPLPEQPMLDIKASLDYDSAVPALNRALAGKSGAWLMTFDETLLDPSRLTRALLRRQSQAFNPVLDNTDFTGLHLLHYRFFQPYAPLPNAAPAMNSRIESGGQERGLSSQGCHQFARPRAGDPWMEAVCFWRIEPGAGVPMDTQVSLRLMDTDGRQVLQSDQPIAPFGLPFLAYDKTIASFYIVPLPADMPAGAYTLRAIPYTADAQISPQVVTDWAVLEKER